MNSTQQKLVKAASLDSALSGTRWRDRMDRWLDAMKPQGMTLAKLIRARRLLDRNEVPESSRCIGFIRWIYPKGSSQPNGIYHCKAGPWKRKPTQP